MRASCAKRRTGGGWGAEPGKTAIEADFAGTHTGEFTGIAATGRAARVSQPGLARRRGDRMRGDHRGPLDSAGVI